MILRKTVICLGLSQLVSWGISYYLVGAFGELIVADLGWGPDIVYGGFSAALLMMGLTSPLAGRLIDRHGGRRVMVAGSVLNAAGCAGIALSHSVPAYFAAWLCLGLAMRLTLYDAAFAALARIGGLGAKRQMAQITLFGGLASTVFWPVGFLLAEHFGWRGAVLVYAGMALLTIPLHVAIPEGRHDDLVKPGAVASLPPLASGRRNRIVAGSLYVAITTLANFLNAAMSSHMIGILAGLGLAVTASVWVSALRGIGQTLSRFSEVVFGARVHPLSLNLAAALLLPFAFAIGLFSGEWLAAALAFAFFYGAGNGVLTITRGTLPLVLFDHRTYGSFVGQLLVPSFLLSASAPLVYALVIDRFGEGAALYLSIASAALILLAAFALERRFGRIARQA